MQTNTLIIIRLYRYGGHLGAARRLARTRDASLWPGQGG